MNEIVSREHIKHKARRAFLSGQPRDSHNMNWHALALPIWLAEYDRLAACAEAPELAEAES